MIDLRNEEAISLAAAAGILPPGRQGRKPTIGCILRWITDGVLAPDGKTRIRLEAARIGGRWLTTLPSLERFALAQTPIFFDDAKTIRTGAKRQTASHKAAAELEAVGI